MKKYKTLAEAKRAFEKRFDVKFSEVADVDGYTIYHINGKVYHYTICNHLDYINEFYKF